MGCGDIGMSHHSAYALNGKPCIQTHYGETVTGTMEGNVTRDDAKEAPIKVLENGFWQGTLIYMKIGTSEEIDPNQIVEHRTNAAEKYNEMFVETEELEALCRCVIGEEVHVPVWMLSNNAD